VPPGKYVALVDAEPFVHAFSEAFALVKGQAMPAVTVRLDNGTEVRARVLDGSGSPVAGAAVRLEPHALPSDAPITAFFAAHAIANLGDLFTTALGRTGPDGSFRFARVVAGRYAILVEHPDWCRLEVAGLTVERGTQAVVPPLVLTPGTLLEGIVRDAEGQSVDGAQLTIGKDVAPLEGVRRLDRTEAERVWRVTTGAEGRFRLGFRLPPGRYRVAPAPRPDGNPLQQIAGIQAAARVVTVEPGAERVQADLVVGR
jgi:hypothetical protein